MPSFADSFWSTDYAGGLGILFQKLQQGVAENQQVLTIASMRADAEEIYSQSLGSIAPTVDRMTGGFARDDGASVRKAYEGVRSEMVEASKNHTKISQNIRELVVNPFSRWCDAHATRIQNSQDDLQSKIKAHDKQAETVKKLRSQYFNKCRLVEDQEEENKLAFQEPEKEPNAKSQTPPPPRLVLPEASEDEVPVEIGDVTYTPDRLKTLLGHMIETVAMGEFKVPILGTYQNTSAGTDIVEYIQKSMRAPNVGYAEKIGQDLVDRGFLRLVGNVGSTFANSSKLRYQWRPRTWQIAGIPERKRALARSGTVMSLDSVPESPLVGNITETLQAWMPLNNAHPNETPAEKLKRESREADDRYKAGVRRLDSLRCSLEESMMDHLKFLERCETDRLKAIKSVVLDFSGAISNSIPSFQSQVDNMMLYQETIQPLGDLRYMLENYRTGIYAPRVTPYENYYGSVDDQIFGVDLEARARADRKRVPIIVTSILTYLDNHYPDLEGDEARRSIWVVDVPLSHTHQLRNTINSSAQIQRELYEKYEIPVVASVLKLYLLELPDSLVSSQIYEIIKTIYSTTPDAVPNPISSEAIDSAPRIKVLQSTLGQLRLNNIATLDALTTHFTRLIDLTSADEAYIANLAQTLAPCVLRPRTENSLTMDERHSYRLVRDLFDHKEAIFGELKRQSSSQALGGGPGSLVPTNPNRARAVSNADESNRRFAVEERVKAITEQRIRDKSPLPSSRHRRDKSTDGGMGRFPVVASPKPAGINKRQSLEVPGSPENTPANNALQQRSVTNPVMSSTASMMASNAAHRPTTNGHTPSIPPISTSVSVPSVFSGGGPGPHIPPPTDDDSSHNSPVTATSTATDTGVPGAFPEEDSGGMGSASGSLKRTTAGHGGKAGGRRGGSLGGGLKRNPSREIGGFGSTRVESPPQTHGQDHNQGVELVDRPMDD